MKTWMNDVFQAVLLEMCPSPKEEVRSRPIGFHSRPIGPLLSNPRKYLGDPVNGDMLMLLDDDHAYLPHAIDDLWHKQSSLGTEYVSASVHRRVSDLWKMWEDFLYYFVILMSTPFAEFFINTNC